jgi:ParB-like chromosome segregation protein Spo0J
MQDILVEKIRTDKSVQSRAAINPDYVAELVEQIKNGKKLPPIDVYKSGDDIWMADGFHRLRAHEDAGKRTIRAEVHKGGEHDAAWASCGANQSHGLRRTNPDKRRAVELALSMRPQSSDQVIAEHVGVSREFVLRLRPRPVIGSQVTERTGIDGVTRKLPPPQGLTRKILPPPVGAKTPPPPPAHKAAAEVDEVGKVIPEHLQMLFDRIPEVQTLLSQISSIKSVLKKAEESGDPLFAEVHFATVYANLQTAYDGIKSTKPHAVCPWCKGVMSKECRGCAGRGVLGEYRYNTTVPRELKK